MKAIAYSLLLIVCASCCAADVMVSQGSMPVYSRMRLVFAGSHEPVGSAEVEYTCLSANPGAADLFKVRPKEGSPAVRRFGRTDGDGIVSLEIIYVVSTYERSRNGVAEKVERRRPYGELKALVDGEWTRCSFSKEDGGRILVEFIVPHEEKEPEA